ncbi:hypothetical protein [Robertmurraya sp.]
MNQLNLAHLQHIRDIVDAHIRKHQNDLQTVMEYPDLPFFQKHKFRN